MELEVGRRFKSEETYIDLWLTDVDIGQKQHNVVKQFSSN